MYQFIVLNLCLHFDRKVLSRNFRLKGGDVMCLEEDHVNKCGLRLVIVFQSSNGFPFAVFCFWNVTVWVRSEQQETRILFVMLGGLFGTWQDERLQTANLFFSRGNCQRKVTGELHRFVKRFHFIKQHPVISHKPRKLVAKKAPNVWRCLMKIHHIFLGGELRCDMS